MFVYQLISSSQPFGFDESSLVAILMDARRINARNGVTGALVCRAEVYLQLLEGPKTTVLETMERIRRDDRHVDIRVHVSERSPERLFGEWAMHHDPAASWHWSREEVAAGALARATPQQVREVFARLSRTTRNAG